ncbi:hypothetical protein C1X64_19795 [Pseudomonas sp. GW456-E7]|nr:hypothetical protein C1X64_19795 [Pseudomonas sp. GW456-E7]
MDPKRIERIENKIRGVLKNCLIKDSWPDYESVSTHLESLSKEILKDKKEWIDSIDVFSIFYDFTYEAVRAVVGESPAIEGQLWNEILGEENGQHLTNTFRDYLLSIPREIHVYLPIPEITKNIPTTIILSKDASLVSFLEADQVPGGYTRSLLSPDNKLDLGKVYLKQRIYGHASRRFESTGNKIAINNFKIILQQGITKGLFKQSKEGKAGFGLFGLLTHHHIKKLTIVSIDEGFEKPKTITSELPIDLCKLLNSIDINWDDESIKNSNEQNQLDRTITSTLTKPVQLIEFSGDEATRVKAAIIWCFDSYIVENQTLAFLQVCFGLEALLGDMTYNGNLTETLADRCSYLISNNIKGRRAIKKNFKELYEVRSKLVHGNATELDSNQLGHLNWGKSILEFAIFKEIKHLDL